MRASLSKYVQAHGPACKLMDLKASQNVMAHFWGLLMKLPPSSWNLTQAHGTSCKLGGLSVSSYDFMEAYGTSWKLMEPPVSSWNLMGAHGTSCKLMGTSDELIELLTLNYINCCKNVEILTCWRTNRPTGRQDIVNLLSCVFAAKTLFVV